MAEILILGFYFIASYLLGSISSAVIVCKLLGLPDPRTQGSKNPGATNVTRIGGKKAGYLTFLGDFLKGFLPVLVAILLNANDKAIALAGLGAFLGHLYPIFFAFKGGKGIATLVGIIAALSWKLLLGFVVVWVGLLLTSGFVSLASMLAAVAVFILAWVLGYSVVIVVLFAVLAALVIYRHRSNIVNLKQGKELHFRKKKKD